MPIYRSIRAPADKKGRAPGSGTRPRSGVVSDGRMTVPVPQRQNRNLLRPSTCSAPKLRQAGLAVTATVAQAPVPRERQPWPHERIGRIFHPRRLIHSRRLTCAVLVCCPCPKSGAGNVPPIIFSSSPIPRGSWCRRLRDGKPWQSVTLALYQPPSRSSLRTTAGWSATTDGRQHPLVGILAVSSM